MKAINIEGLLSLIRKYRENIIYKESSNGHISLSERAELEEILKKQGRIIDMAIFHFKNPECNECANFHFCFKAKSPSINCFEYGEI